MSYFTLSMHVFVVFHCSCQTVLLPQPSKFNGQAVSTVDYFRSLLVELATVVEDQVNVALEVVLVYVAVSSHLGHYCLNVHRLRDRIQVFLIDIFIT